MATPPFIPNSNSGGFFNSPLFSGILSTLGGVATGILGNMAANTQADAATNASKQAQDTLLGIYNQQRSDAAPYTLAGYGAINRLSDLLGINPQRYSGTATAPQVSNPQPSNAYIGGGLGMPVYYPNSDIDPSLNDVPLSGLASYKTIFPGQPYNTSGQGYGPYQTQASTAQAPANGGQLPSDFGSLNHDFSLADFSADPGYAFRQTEGQKAIERSAAARGSVLGGGTLKALTRYGQDTASQEFGNAFNRYQVNRTNKINPLLSLSNLGQVSAGQVANAGTNFGNNSSSLLYQGATDAANARASGYASTANGINSGINSINNLSLLRQLGRV